MRTITKSFLRFLSHQYSSCNNFLHYSLCNNFFKKYRPQLEAKDSDSDSVSVQSIIHESHDHQNPRFFPDHLIALILQNLNIPNRTRATLVCKSWKNILTQADFPPARDEAPWLIMSKDTYRKPESFLSEIHFESFSENRIYRFTLPNPYGDHLGGGWLCGSSRGWLLIATGPDLNPYMFLWNPISGSVRNLPPLSTLPFFNDFVEDGIFMLATNVSSLIPTNVFAVGSEECVVAVIFRNPFLSLNSVDSDVLALCTPHDTAWTVYRREHNVQYEDILFHDGKLHALTVIKIQSDDEIGNWDFNDTIGLPGCEVELKPIFCYRRINNIDDDEEEEDDPLGVSISSDKFYRGHLVECSITGEVVCVRAIYKSCRFNSIGGPIESFELYQMVDYKIYSLKNPPRYEVMSSLGEQTAFVGTAGSIAVNGGVRGGQADRIFFATERQDMRVENDMAFSVRYQGVFNVGERKIRTTCLQQLDYPLQSKIGWFTPKP